MAAPIGGEGTPRVAVVGASKSGALADRLGFLMALMLMVVSAATTLIKMV